MQVVLIFDDGLWLRLYSDLPHPVPGDNEEFKMNEAIEHDPCEIHDNVGTVYARAAGGSSGGDDHRVIEALYSPGVPEDAHTLWVRTRRGTVEIQLD